MLKKLREKSKNKKGFTLVELIVVIVIILVLAAVMVPSILRYVNRAHEANCKADAATILVQLQAEVADAYLADAAAPTLPTGPINSVPCANPQTGSYTAAGAAEYTYVLNGDGDIVSFAYRNPRNFVNWTTNGWLDVDEAVTTP
ncbi:prepilin-type N-terminal cleavage/methylation domain-containing protein [Ruminococcus sp. OA3]|uniref:prepilin-type N-terminal cleavage/methylation domain-containing protein n=1 Tax=Ruminococcus sp. OA3 TaxID=2914164 RepID=UPI001F051828|nr:prepilin-type N-terminal cleavage/methylation domain-containing protein [Ruminococcus sp. OA3]MCH1983049.1 prepilin-type N-terminal cleavage/methylation domain-containing protein [Ruminococcus sp. OA3]